MKKKLSASLKNSERLAKETSSIVADSLSGVAKSNSAQNAEKQGKFQVSALWLSLKKSFITELKSIHKIRVAGGVRIFSSGRRLRH